MAVDRRTVQRQLARQAAHWRAASEELGDLSQIAAPLAWRALDPALDATVRRALEQAITRLQRRGEAVCARALSVEGLVSLAELKRDVQSFRKRYLAVEALLDFYGDAINTRTNPRIGAYLRACDFLARAALRASLECLGRPAPLVLTYLEPGAGARILSAGLQLWDGQTRSPVAAIMVPKHNLLTPTAVCHEIGHQCCRLTGWASELAQALATGLRDASLSRVWSSWASEVAADAYAFVHTGFASLAALLDVIATDDASVLRVNPFDPHPAGYLRILLGRTMCRRFFGSGPWDELTQAFCANYTLERAPSAARAVLERSLPELERISEIVLERSYAAFGGRTLSTIIDPQRVRPDALSELQRTAGDALFTSNDWMRRECLRILALSGWQLATLPEQFPMLMARQKAWLRALGNTPAMA